MRIGKHQEDFILKLTKKEMRYFMHICALNVSVPKVFSDSLSGGYEFTKEEYSFEFLKNLLDDTWQWWVHSGYFQKGTPMKGRSPKGGTK